MTTPISLANSNGMAVRITLKFYTRWLPCMAVCAMLIAMFGYPINLSVNSVGMALCAMSCSYWLLCMLKC